MKKIKAFIFIIGMLILSACGSSSKPIPSTAIPSATKPLPTATITPTYTPSPTLTLTPTPIPQPITSSNIDKISEDFQIGVGTISDISWLPDGNIALTHSVGVSIYDAKTFKLIKIVRPINKVSLTDSVVSHNGKYVASLVDSKTIQVWNINSGEITYEIKTQCYPALSLENRIGFSHDDTKLFGCDEKGISIWELSDLKKTVALETRFSFSTIIVNSDDSYMAVFGFSSGGGYGENFVWNITTGQTVRTFPNSLYMGFSHDGTMLAVADQTNVVIYEMSSDKVLTTISGFGGPVEFSDDDKVIAIGGYGIKFADVSTGKFISDLENVRASIIRYSPDGSRLAIGSYDVSVWDITKNNDYKQIGKTERFNPYSQVVLDPKSKYIAVGGRASFTTLWDLEKKVAVEFRDVRAYGDNFIFDPTGTFLITRAWNNDNNWWGSIKSWNLRTKTATYFDDFIEKEADTSSSSLPLFCPTDHCIAVGIEYHQIKFWDTLSHKFLFTLEQPGLSDYEFSPNGAIFASSGNNVLNFWDLKTQKSIRKLYAKGQISDISFSPDNTLIAWADDDGVLVFQKDNFQFAKKFKDIKRARNIAFSPTGNLLAAIGYVGRVWDSQPILFVWDVSNSNLLYQIKGGQTFDESLRYPEFVFSPDGSLIALKGFSPHVQFVDTATGQLLKSLDTIESFLNLSNLILVLSNTDSPNSFGFSADGRLFAAIDVYGVVHILNIAP